MNKPAYLKLYSKDKLRERVRLLRENLSSCSLCPRNCRVDRANGELGFCRATLETKIAFYKRHFGEEPPLSAKNGSGVIFFSNCTAKCTFCQNFHFSQKNTGFGVSQRNLAKIMLRIQGWGCHNINLVTPTQYLPQIVSALNMAIKEGLNIPLVFNSSGWENCSTLKLLEGMIDIYLPDMKYSDDDTAKKLSGFVDYVETNRKAVLEMFRQVGILKVGKDGIARKGLIIRHLILPEDTSGTGSVMKFISESLSRKIHISLMDQYFPEYKASDFAAINRKISEAEYQNAITLFYEYGLQNGWIQEHITNK